MKLFILRKSFIIVFAVIIAFAAAVGIFSAVAVANTHSGSITIVIDAGHGGVDAGVIGIKSKTKESEINLKIAMYLRGCFVDAGFNTVLTRSTSGGLYGTSTKGFKMRDMKKRKQIIEKSNADMVISIHQNYCPIPSKRGATVFFDKNSKSGKELAQSIQSSINSMPQCASENEVLVGDYYMLKCTKKPSVICECGFLSNEKDDELLNDKEYQKSIAQAIFFGAMSFYS